MRRGNEPPPHQPGAWKSAVGSQGGDRGRAPTTKAFDALRAQIMHLVVANFISLW